MREINMIVVHCSATRCNRRYTLEQLRHDHVVVNQWRDIGYHYYITLDGVVHPCRPVERMGAHAKGYNGHSIGICYEGRLNENGCIADTRTPVQKEAMRQLILDLCAAVSQPSERCRSIGTCQACRRAALDSMPGSCSICCMNNNNKERENRAVLPFFVIVIHTMEGVAS